jgi:hypothetical protein
MNHRRRGILGALTALVVIGTGCVPLSAFRFLSDEDFTLTLDEAAAGTLTIDWHNGTIEVVFDETATAITATGRKYVTGALSASSAANALDDITITLSAAGTDPEQVTLRLQTPSATPPSYGANVTVTVPAGLTLAVDSDNGNVTVTGNAGSTTIDLDNGNVVVADQAGDVDIDVANGQVEAASTAGDVTVDVNNGTVEVAAEPNADGNVVVSVNVGSITVHVPADFAATLDLRTDVGAVDLEDVSAFSITDLSQSLTHVTATLNGGGGTITAQTDVGTVQFGAATN